MNNKSLKITGSLLVIVTLCLGVVFFVWTLVPFLQLGNFYHKISSAFSGKQESFKETDFLFTPFTSAQGLIRYNFVNTMLDQYRAGRVTKVHPLLTVSIERLKEYVAREPYFPNYFFLLGRATDLMADLNNNDQNFLKEAEGYYVQGLALNPYRQDGRYAYAINLTNQGREADAQKVIRETLSENKAVPESHYYVGVLELKRTKPDKVFALSEIETALTGGANPDPKLTLQIYDIFFNYFYTKKDLERFQVVLERKKQLDPKQNQTYDAILNDIKKNGSIPAINLLPLK